MSLVARARGARRLPRILALGAIALALAGCQTEQQGLATALQPGGATIAFDSIDGLPQQQFRELVNDLNQEARTRQIAVSSRGQASVYRVRGYFAAAVEKGRTTVSWVFDVFDRDEHRALRISGSAPVNGKDWSAADASLMQKIAAASMDELAGLLGSSAVASTAPAAGAELALAAKSAPAAAGIFSGAVEGR